MSRAIIDQIVEQLKVMPQPMQQQVLQFARELGQSKIQGIPGKDLLKFAGTLPPDDLALMKAAIEQDW
ncbi:hypothetical protein IQ241_23470 [Romeria aff. gracilis LEGE 07310]|uniref:Uncharacterized protein n=1 Tax=Vasconcelosia minhoensis LEGE 07310 TaxID=915328 RepID=A0A8J7DPS4_9CYAN|nr:hypothetical protein [Romeria gracilis]MBE9080210.1 hypothetical protein [Romeria aff. gracilis LEGE 07310]